MEEEKNQEEIKENEIDIEAIQNQTLRGDVVVYPGDKKRNLKKALAIIIPSVVVLIGCVIALYFLLIPHSKTFSYLEMEITLNSDFYEKSNINYATTYQSDDMLVTLTRETIDELSEVTYLDENSTCTNYLNLLIDSYDLLCSVRDENGIKYIEYYKTISGIGYFCRGYAYKHNGAFWFIQMICFSEDTNELKPKMQEYAVSVKFVRWCF